MLKKLKKNKKKGFTLVELIVVLVILAILAALLIPALTGYINKAKDKQITAETRQVVMAAQTVTSEDYAKAATGKLTAGNLTSGGTPDLDEVLKLAEITLNKNGVTAVTVHVTVDGHVDTVSVTQSGKTCTYNEDATQNANSENYYVG